ncbi:MAG: carbohydrate ABC transporter permease [Caldilineaceae bacterium]|nr:carbohydrate ABC transporter permease [Caldilineaceae bacterium]
MANTTLPQRGELRPVSTPTEHRPWLGSHRHQEQLRTLGSFAAIVLVGLFFIVPFLWMLSTALKSDQDVFRTPPTLLPHDVRQVTIGGAIYPVYAVEVEGQVRELALLTIADGRGDFVDPAVPDEILNIRMRYAEPILDVGPRWRNFPDALNRATRPSLNVNFWTYIQNSLIVAIFSIIGTLLSCAPAAYGFARVKWWGRDVVFVLVLATMMLPFQVTMIPLYILFTGTLAWGNTFLPLIVPTFFGNAFDIFLLRQFFRTIPEELADAARIDGASEFRIFWAIMLPLSKPVLAAITVFTFLWAWNDFTGPLLYLTDPRRFTMALRLQDFQGQHAVSWNLLMAAAAVFTVPIVILFFFAQRTFIQGVKLTGLKG